MKILVVNADDFGLTRDVNEGIVAAHRDGILTAATLMATAPAFEHAVELARDTPSLDIGCHLVLVGASGFPSTVAALVRAVARKRIAIHRELVSQVRRILGAGIVPTHLDTHKHTHLIPQVLDAVARISEEFRIPWVRRPFDFPFTAAGVPLSTRVAGAAFGLMRGRFARVLGSHGCKSTDHFAGFRMTGRFGADELVGLIRQLPDGATEFMCHPGYLTEELRAAPTRLKESRQRELEALISRQVRAALESAGVVLSNYRQLG